MVEKVHILTVPEIATMEFKDHVLEILVEPTEYAGMWRCKKPGTGIHSFTIAIAPGGFIMIAGDVGDVILRCSYQRLFDVIAWIRGSVNSPDYFVQKAQPVCRDAMKEFDPQEAKDHLAELKKNAEDYGMTEADIDKIRELWGYSNYGDESEQGWLEAYYEVTNDCDIPRCQVLSSDALWAIECCRLFCKLLMDAPDMKLMQTRAATREMIDSIELDLTKYEVGSLHYNELRSAQMALLWSIGESGKAY